MNFKRIYYPVGHGGFSEEVLYKDNKKLLSVVYDCGTSKKELIENVLNKREEIHEDMNLKDKSIDFIFISHYHSDHINMLEDLNKRCKIKNIVLPLISDAEKIYYLIELLIKEEYKSGDRNKIIFFEKLFNGTLSDINIIFQNSDEKNKEDNHDMKNQDYNNRVVNIEKINLEKMIHNHTILTYKSIWRYIPFYIKDSNITDKIINDFNNEFKGLIDIKKDTLINYSILFENLDDIKVFYKLFKKELTDSKKYKYNPHKNNLTLYSGPIDVKEKNNACLYTGDIHHTDQVVNRIIEYYNSMNVWRYNLNTLIWPHHGSCRYYKPQLHIKFKEFIIFANKTGIYSKTNPCPSLRHFMDKLSNVHWVDELEEHIENIHLI